MRTILTWVYIQNSEEEYRADAWYAVPVNHKHLSEKVAAILKYKNSSNYNCSTYPNDEDWTFLTCLNLESAKLTIERHLESYNFKFVTKPFEVLM